MSLVYNVLYCVDDTVIVFTSIFPWQIFVKLLSKSWKQVGWMGCTCRLPFCAVIRHLYFFTASMTLYFHLKLITVTRKEVHKIFKVKSLQALLKPFSSHCRWDAGKISSVHSKLQARILFKFVNYSQNWSPTSYLLISCREWWKERLYVSVTTFATHRKLEQKCAWLKPSVKTALSKLPPSRFLSNTFESSSKCKQKPL